MRIFARSVACIVEIYKPRPLPLIVWVCHYSLIDSELQKSYMTYDVALRWFEVIQGH